MKYIVFILGILVILLGLLFSYDKLNKEEISNIIDEGKLATTSITTVNALPITTQITTTIMKISETTKQNTTIVNQTEYKTETECIKENSQQDSHLELSEDYEEYNETASDIVLETYSAWYTAKWYPGSPGSWGEYPNGERVELISGYSVASPDFPKGTILQIVGGGLDGIYRVDDTGCPSGVIDFFYNYGEVPKHFEYAGVYDILVSVVE